jgi:hypothetical protein
MSGRSVLLITKYFAPDRVVGAVRVSEWCRHLPEMGWHPTVIARGGVPLPEAEGECRRVPEVEVIYLQARSAPGPDGPRPWRGRGAAATRRAKRIVEELQPFVPDPGIGTWRSAERMVLQVVERLQPDVVLTTSPPHSIHSLGMAVVRAFPGVPWVADFRDPYLLDERYGPRALGRLRVRGHRAFEAAVYRHAHLILHAIPLHYRHARLRYPEARDRIRMLLNGTPATLTDVAPESPGERVRLAAVGNADPGEAATLIEAVAALVEGGADLELRLTGLDPWDAARLPRILGDRLICRGRVSHADAIGEIERADVLIGLTGSRRARGLGLSSKLFEYLAVPRPSIFVNPTRSDAAFLRSRAGVTLLRSPGPWEWERVLLEVLEGRTGRDCREAAEFARTFSRREQTRLLASWLDELPFEWPAGR